MSTTDDMITVALGKGRLAKKAMGLFDKIGLGVEEIHDPDTRKLIFTNERDLMFRRMWSTVRLISELSERTLSLRRTAISTR